MFANVKLKWLTHVNDIPAKHEHVKIVVAQSTIWIHCCIDAMLAEREEQG